MNVGIHHPAWHICGGGEAYVGSMAEELAKRHSVTLLVTTPFDRGRLSKLLGLRFQNVHIEKLDDNTVSRAMETFDVGIRVATERIPRASARRNLLHVQVPIVPRGTLRSRWLGFANRRAITDYDKVVFNSEFTAATSGALSLASETPVVVYPPVDVGSGDWRRWIDRNPAVLAVGRFAAHGHPKCQLELIGTFRRLLDAGLRGWKLVLVGSVATDPVSLDYLSRVRRAAEGYPIDVLVDLTREELMEHYSASRIFWHAAGLGVDETRAPENVEHFGISTVEAMARGAIPIVVDLGGQREIVDHGVNGFRWSTASELEWKTWQVIRNGEANDEMAERSVRAARRFSRERFGRQVAALIGDEPPVE